MPSRRVDRVASLLKQVISRVIVTELSDPRMGFVTVVKVELSPDMKDAKVFVSVLGEGSEITRTLHGLRHAGGFIRREVAHQMDLRVVPRLLFVEDKSVKGSVRVSRLIADALAGSKPAGGAEGEEGAQGGGESGEPADDEEEPEEP